MTGLYWITLLAFVLSVTFCLSFRELARKWYLIDTPDARKHHEGNVPLCGGIAIALSFCITIALSPSLFGSASISPFLPGLLLILAIGVIDDRFKLPVAPRLATQLLAALLMIGIAGLNQIHLHLSSEISSTHFEQMNLLGYVLNGPVFFIVALAFIVGLINAVNMSDGVDGLTASSTAASLFWLALISMSASEGWLGFQLLALMASCLGFLVFNMRHRWRARASMFMGDGGSTFLGASLAGAVLLLTGSHAKIAFPILLWVVIVPVIDTLSLIIRRLSARRSPFSPDRQHLHHLLMETGLSSGQTAIAVLLLNLSAGAVAYIAIRLQIPSWTMLLALVAPFIAHTIFVMRMTNAARPIAPPVTADTSSQNKPNITLPGATS